MSKTILQLTGIKEAIACNFSKAVPLPNPSPGLLYGVELEIENTMSSDWEVPGMRSTEDGSLRNHGWEYITQPMTYSNLAYTLDKFFTKSRVTQVGNYSERCSVHVHANCQPLTYEQLSSLLLLYQVFERVLFDFVGEEREKNIFCVPWYETTLSASIVDSIKEKGMAAFKNWQKYTALNLLPLFTLGTIEFRHLPGTCDQKRILEWCRIIGCLFAYAHKQDDHDMLKWTITQLNTNSQYRGFFRDVFPETHTNLIERMDVAKMEEGVLQTKYALLGKKDIVPNPLKPTYIDGPEIAVPPVAVARQRIDPRPRPRVRANPFLGPAGGTAAGAVVPNAPINPWDVEQIQEQHRDWQARFRADLEQARGGLPVRIAELVPPLPDQEEENF